jgi:DNA-binding response OmpR family regulator
MRILVAEDDLHTRAALVELLTADGHVVMAAADGRDAAQLFAREKIDLACLDVMMPCLSGYDLCRQFRAQRPDFPILFLTAKADEIDKVVGLELGADDYIVKPFGSKELLARIRAVSRRYGWQDSASPKISLDADSPFSMGGWTINPRQLRAHRESTNNGGTETVELSAREVRLLRMLYDHAGEVVDRRRLFHCGWGLQRIPNSRTLDQTISQLRKRIDGDSQAQTPSLIQTVYGVGYRFDPP